MSNSVWAVEEGHYSNYHIVGLFSTRKKAQMVCDADAHGEDARVKEYELDPYLDKLHAGLRPFTITMAAMGDTENVFAASLDDSDSLYVVRRTGTEFMRMQYGCDVVSGTVWAKDEEHAAKIANEFRVRMIAEGQLALPATVKPARPPALPGQARPVGWGEPA
jgi:hypothetical protein